MINKMTEEKAREYKFETKISDLYDEVDSICNWLWNRKRNLDFEKIEIIFLKNMVYGICIRFITLTTELADNIVCKISDQELNQMSARIIKVKYRLFQDTFTFNKDCTQIQDVYGGFNDLRNAMNDADITIRNLIKRECSEISPETALKDNLDDDEYDEYDNEHFKES